MFKNNSEVDNLVSYINNKKALYNSYLFKKLNKKLYGLNKKINNGDYKAIVVYPAAVDWEPVQRPHHMLRYLADNGYLCFFCVDDDSSELIVEEKYDNVYLINKQEELFPLINNKRTIVLITYFMQYFFAKYISNCTIWFDVLDKLDFMSFYNYFSKEVYKKILEEADIVTYSASNLYNYVKSRKDAILIENAVNLDDYKLIDESFVLKGCRKIIKNNKPVVGYYGAIEDWFDFDLIKTLDESNKFSIVIIGKVNDSLLDKIDNYDFDNVYFLGKKKYDELKYFGAIFDIAIIPFIVNSLTNSVSPVKFFEYMALNKPVISTGIREMKKYECDIVRIVNKRNVVEQCLKLLQLDNKIIVKGCSRIASENTWSNRLKDIEDLF